MIDLIIPYYNNPEGLKHTLDSINENIFYITIIDDNSDKSPWCPKAHQIFRWNINSGPGNARQLGINKTSNEYIMFLDTGDIFISFEAQQNILDTITLNPQLNIISFAYFHYGELTKIGDNRLHGKIYKRSFLEKYNITFTHESSYLDEDIGFNRLCRLCTEIKFISLPVIEQIRDPNSLTQKNNETARYRDQTRALSLVTIHTINICKKNNINYTQELYTIGAALYYWFIRTAAEHPEYIQNAWNGVKIYYDHFYKELKPNQLMIGSIYLRECLKYKEQVKFPINILRFANDIWKNETIPVLYKEGSCSSQ